MDHGLEVVRPKFMKSPARCHIRDNNKVETALRGIFVSGTNHLRLVLRPKGCNDGVTPLEKCINDMTGNKA